MTAVSVEVCRRFDRSILRHLMDTNGAGWHSGEAAFTKLYFR